MRMKTYEEEADVARLKAYEEENIADLSESDDPAYGLDIGGGLTDDENFSDLELVNEDEAFAEGENEVVEHLVEKEIEFDDNSDDDECRQAKDRLKEWNANALKIAQQLQIEAASGLLAGQDIEQVGAGSVLREGNVSDYDESGDEAETPGESADESIPGKRKIYKFPIVDEKTDLSKLTWSAGIRFPNRDIFREYVIKYAVMQGRDLKFRVSNKSRNNRLGVRCIKGCPFRMYANWHNKQGAFIVKSVVPDHTCQRTMESNTQLKSTWLAQQLLEVFKSRPHWPATKIIETVRRAYRVIIKRGYAYKVKYYAHRLLHGSMKEHYNKIGSYIAALEEGNPTSYFTLFTNPNVPRNPPVFQRFFVCSDALKQGWLLGCRKMLCIDACFLKTFLGGSVDKCSG